MKRNDISLYQPVMNSWFLTGFSDAEASFFILIEHNTKYKTNWRVKAVFSIGLHKKDKVLLEQIKTYFDGGSIYTKHGPQTIQYRVESVKDLEVRHKSFWFLSTFDSKEGWLYFI